MMRYLGIDYGTKRVGVAVSDEEGKVAFPHWVLANDKKLIAALVALCRARGVSEIIVGDSRDFSGAPNKVSAHVERFKKEVAGATGLSVRGEPEFWSSMQAERWQPRRPESSRGSGLRPERRRVKEKLDASAAAIILQSFLDRDKK
ncbi:MAG: Holliday junction resolvase RuvX [bacterium]|nr:Holliday junction resolvase RuvX [bacterium]